MLAKMAVLVPTRGRPGSAKRLSDAFVRTCTSDTHLLLAVDGDDPEFDGYMKLKETLPPGHILYTDESRMNQVTWTNKLAKDTEGDYQYYTQMGDDTVPLTKGWDTNLMGCIE